MALLDQNSPFIYLLHAEFGSSEQEEEWNRWYDQHHVPDLLSVPGFLSATRYKQLGHAHRYLAAYELTSPEVFDHPRYREVSGWGRWAPHIVEWRKAIYRVVDVTDYQSKENTMTAKDTVRLETLAAELAIRDVLHRYALGLDQQDFALIASCFTDDVKAEYSGHPLSGVQGILELLRGAARFERTMHHVGTAVVTMRGDEADSQSYSIAYLVGRETDDECYLSLRAVRYIDKFRLVNGSWRIYERVHTVDWSSTAPAMLAPPLPPEFLAATLGS